MSEKDSQRAPPPDAAIPAGRDETAPYETGSEPTAHNEAARAGSDARLRPGDTVAGRFVIVRFIARGGMGEVYEANDTVLRTRVAVKTLRPEFAADATSLDRFRREVLLARSVAHPNICRVFELHSTTVDGTSLTFLTMEYLEGESLAGFLTRKGSLEPAEALPLVRQMAAALDAAHAHGVVHRDFKPSNVVLVSPRAGSGSDEPRVVVTDFGIARSLASAREAFETTGGTGTEEFLGTPTYVAPEQVSREVEVGPRADLYSFGVVLYEMVTGALPFEADTPMGAMLRRLKDSPRPPELVRRGLDPRWNHAILHCLETDPGSRPSNASQVMAELTGEVPRPRQARRRAWRWGACAVSVLVIAGLIAWYGRSRVFIGRDSPRRVAVLSLATQLPPGEGWLGPSLGHLLSAELADAKELIVEPWWRIGTVYPSLGLDADQVLDDEKRARIYEVLPADDFVEGSIQCPTEPGSTTCRLRLGVQRRDGSTVGRTEKTFPASEMTAAVAEVGAELRRMLGGTYDPSVSQGLAARRSRSANVSKLLGQGMAAYVRYDLSRARELLALATSAAPGDFDAQDALSRVLERQGLFVAARRAAERAAEATRSLPPAVQRAARARAEFLGDDRLRAVAAYQAILHERPGDTEVVLALSRRLPEAEALELVKRARALPGAPSRDLLLAIQEALLEQQAGHDDRARQLWALTGDTAARVKARRELSLIAALDWKVPYQGGRRDLARAERLAQEVGDRQRAAYLHLLVTGNPENEQQIRMNEECLDRFRALGDKVGAHHSLVLRAYSQRDLDASSRILAEAAAELESTGEPASRAYWIATAELELHRGSIALARRALDAAKESLSRPSLDLLIDLPSLPPPTDPADLEFEILAQEDRLDEAEAMARDRVREDPGADFPEGYLCRVQCERGRTDEGSRCYRQMLGSGPRVNRWGRAAAVCAWEGHDEKEAEYAGWASSHPGVTSALRYSGGGRAELDAMIGSARRNHDVLKELQLQFLLGSAEMRSWSLWGRLPELKVDVARGRRRLQSLATDASRRGYRLLARKATAEASRDPFARPSLPPR